MLFTLAGMPALAVETREPSWPMLAHDAARSGATTDEIRPPFARQWYRLFPDEGLMAGVQPVVADGCVFVGTLAGVLHAVDVQTGQDRWTYRAGGPLLHACAAVDGKVFFGGADGKIYAVHSRDGRLAWTVQTGAAVWNAPAVHQGTVLVGSRDGRLYAVRAENGKTLWSATTAGPLLGSPAVDARAGRVYAGSEDMHVYAFAIDDGRQIWRSDKLPGVTMRGYHPVIAPDGAVMITVAPVASLDRIAAILLEMVKDVFGDFASWRHSKDENRRLREANFSLLQKPETYRRQMDYLRRRLTEEPGYQTFFVFDPATGRQRFVAPIVYAESMNGTGAPAVVTPDGRVIVKYQALLRSRYEHYSPFLNVGYLDTASGDITPIMDQSRTYGWHDSLLLVHDEQCQLSLAGRVLINTHQDNVNGLDLDTLQGYGEPFCRNIHEPQPGEGVGLWSRVLRGQPIPVGKEWLARGTALYGGGSVIDVPVSIAGDRFYYIPTHEINAGAAVIAYRMQADGPSPPATLPPAGRLTDAEWQTVQKLPWDWDTLAMPRLDHVPKALPGSVPGTAQQPLRDEAAQTVAAMTDAELDRFIWEAVRRESHPAGRRSVAPADTANPAPPGSPHPADTAEAANPAGRGSPDPVDTANPARRGSPDPADTANPAGRGSPDPAETDDRRSPAAIPSDTLHESLAGSVRELIAEPWRPLVFPSGKHPEEAYRFFADPTETLYALARAYPHLDADLQQQVKQFVAAWAAPDGPLAGPTGRRTVPSDRGETRSAYDVPEHLLRVTDDIVRSPLARLYPFWLWAHVTNDWSRLERDWEQLRPLADNPPNAMEEDCRNGYVAGLIAYCRLAHHIGDRQSVERGLMRARQALRERLQYELAHPRGGLITRVPVLRSIFGRWRHLTPEVGRLLQTHAEPTHQHLVQTYVDHHRPTWWLAWNVELMVRNESPVAFPTMAAEVFDARTLILDESPGPLARYLDLPWCRADLFYLQKLVGCLEAGCESAWQDVR
jgi:hypothetical protein